VTIGATVTLAAFALIKYGESVKMRYRDVIDMKDDST